MMKRPEPPYYAVIFSNQRTDAENEEYGAMAERMAELAAQQPGYLGHDTVRGEDGFGITVSYWRDEEAVRNWKRVAEHREAQRLGRERWYRAYRLRVAKVEREYGFERTGTEAAAEQTDL